VRDQLPAERGQLLEGLAYGLLNHRRPADIILQHGEHLLVQDVHPAD
jgi:hypothetical protein